MPFSPDDDSREADSDAAGGDFFERFDRWAAELDAAVTTGVSDGEEAASGDSDDESATTSDSDDGPADGTVALVAAFVLVQTLGEYGVVDAEWLRAAWERREETRLEDGERAALDAFFADVAALFETGGALEHVAQHVSVGVDCPASVEVQETNAAALSRALERVLGVGEGRPEALPGVTDGEYGRIDEDVFGRIYERHLAEGREGRGIYYTPRYLSDWVVADTVGTELRRMSTRIEEAVETGSWDEADAAVEAFTEFTVLDPACGTGSFLVAAYAAIRDEYERVFDVIDAERRSREQSASGEPQSDGTSRREPETAAIDRLDALLTRLGRATTDDGSPRHRERRVASSIVLRHLHGVDLDRRALDVAKLNLWLETLRHGRVGDEAGPPDGACVFPALDANLGWGDALVGLSDDRVRRRLRERYADEMQTVQRARTQYLEDPDDPTPLRRATTLLSEIRDDLDAAFEASLEAEGARSAVVDETRPFYWPLQFWHVLGGVGDLDDGENDGSSDAEDGDAGGYNGSRGFDCVVGNPPWTRVENDHVRRFLAGRYDLQSGQPDLYRYFLERSFAATTGRLGMVTPNTWLSIPGARALRRTLLCDGRVEKIAFVPDSAFTGVGQNSVAVVVETGTTHGDASNADGDASNADGDASNADGDASIRVGDIDPSGAFSAVRAVDTAGIDPPAYHINPYVGPAEQSIIAAMEATATEVREIADLTVGYQLYHRSLHTDAQIDDEVFHSETRASPDYVADTRSDALTRYHLDRSERRYVDASAEFFRIPPRRFRDGEKLLLREVPSKTEAGLIAARSEGPLLFPKSVISVVLTDDDYDYEHLLGLLNSRLLYLASLVTGEKMGQDLFPRVSATQLRGLPIEGTTELTPLVRRLERLTSASRRFRRCWSRRTGSSTVGTRPLGQLLDSETRGGDANGGVAERKPWTVAWSVGSGGGEESAFDRRYPAFEVVGSVDDPVVVVEGLDSGVEHELLRVEFRSRAVQQLVYLSLRTLFESRAKVEHLDHVLEKTSVPVGEGIEDAVQTMRDVKRRFASEERRTDSGDADTVDGPDAGSADVVKIDEARAAAQRELDAAVFDLYGLTRDEARAVLSALEVRETVVAETLARLGDRESETRARRSEADDS